LPVRGPWATTGGTVPGGVAPGSGDDDGDGTAAGIRTDVLGPTGPPSPAAVHPASTNATAATQQAKPVPLGTGASSHSQQGRMATAPHRSGRSVRTLAANGGVARGLSEANLSYRYSR